MEFILVFLLVFVTTALANKENPLAGICDPETCRLPDCRCSSTSIPGGLLPEKTPQFVLVTFDDAVNVANIITYREVLYNRHNSNGCPIGATFYVSHEYTNYQLVNELYNRQFEIALHSITHRTPNTFWAHASYNDLMQEFGDQIMLMSHFANIPRKGMHGIRSPFLQVSGNNSFQVIKDTGLIYDSSMPTNTLRNPGLWPYTLDYASIQDCVVEPCPTASIPGAWILPMISWTDLAGIPCSMVDSCFHVPDHTDENAWLEFILENFNRHYKGNRAPFGFYIHAWYLDIHPAVKRALIKFLDIITNSGDIFVVNSIDVIEWVRKPIPVQKYTLKSCRGFKHAGCPGSSCGPLLRDEMSYWMQICNACPRVYPWTGNPLGR